MSYSAEDWSKSFCRCPELPLSLVLYSQLQLLWPFWSPSSISSAQGGLPSSSWIPPLFTAAWPLSLDSKLNHSADLICFLPLWTRVLHSCLFHSFCLVWLFIYFSCSRRENSVLVPPFWLPRLDYFKLLWYC